MNSSQAPLASVAAAGTAIGSLVARHLELTWRGLMNGRGSDAGSGWFCSISGEAHPLGNLALVSAPDDVDATVAAIAPLRALALPSAVFYTNGVSAAVTDVLAEAGFAPIGDMPAMAVEIDRLAATALPAGYALERTDAGEAALAWTDAMASGYGLPRGLARLLSPETLGADMTDDAAVQCFGIRDAQRRLVCTSMLYLADGMAGIYCVATVPDARGQGLGAHATAEPLRRAHALGYRVGVLQSSEAGHGVYRRLGFQDVGRIPMFMRMPQP